MAHRASAPATIPKAGLLEPAAPVNCEGGTDVVAAGGGRTDEAGGAGGADEGETGLGVEAGGAGAGVDDLGGTGV